MWSPVYASYQYYKAKVAVLMAADTNAGTKAKAAYDALLVTYGKLKSDKEWAA